MELRFSAFNSLLMRFNEELVKRELELFKLLSILF